MMKDDLTPVLEKAYDDVVHPAASATGKFFGLIPQVIYTALLPLRKWINDREKYFEEIGELLTKKLNNVEEEKIITPEPYVAVPAIQALSYSLDNNELKNLYANLLVSAMNTDTQEYVHPAFVEIIKQLSPIDALIFKEIMSRECVPMIDLYYCEFKSAKGQLIERNITSIEISSHKTMSVSIDNLKRLGIIESPVESSELADKDAYNNILNSENYKDIKSNFKERIEGYEFYDDKKSIKATDFGEMFYQICVKD